MKTKNNTYLSIFFLALAFFLFPQGRAHADVASVLYIQGPGGTVLVNTSLVVPTTCNVQDSTGAVHTFTGHKAPCALQAAKNTGVIANFQVTDAGFGFSLDSINSIANTPGWTEFWHLWKNGTLSDVGIQGIVLSSGDTFQLTYGPWLTGIIHVPQAVSGGGPVSTDIYPRRFRVEDAISFLVMNQQNDGSFGHPLFTDWAAIALGAYQGNSASAFYAKNALGAWMYKNLVPEGSILTDFERRAMALMALGINPYNGTGTNYIQAILSGFDGKQFGSPSLVNDDMFALLVLLKAGYQENEEPLANALQFILASQKENGSWGDADITSAAVQMLDLFSSTKERDKALTLAKEYLAAKQESTGGFGNVYSTSWVLQAISAMQENGDSWIIDNRTPEHFLALRQALDGGLLQDESKENRMWATSYAIPAALGKDWGKILVAFEKPFDVTQGKPTQVETTVIAQTGLDPVLASEIQAQLGVIAKETEVLGLKVVQFQLADVSKKIAALEPRVLAFVESQERGLALELQPQPLVKAEAFSEEPLATESLQAGEFSASPVQSGTGGIYEARAGAAQLPWKTFLPYVVTGVVLAFVLFGNPTSVVSFVRRRFLFRQL